MSNHPSWEDLAAAAADLASALSAHAWTLTTAESCTGGLLAAACTSVPGSSTWFERGVVTYSNIAKTELLGVPPELIAREGAVSEAVARAMAIGALRSTPCQVAMAVTGIAGPGGGDNSEKPVGLVWLAWALRADKPCGQGHDHGNGHTGSQVHSLRLQCQGDRHAVRVQTVLAALQQLKRLAGGGISGVGQ